MGAGGEIEFPYRGVNVRVTRLRPRPLLVVAVRGRARVVGAPRTGRKRRRPALLPGARHVDADDLFLLFDLLLLRRTLLRHVIHGLTGRGRGLTERPGIVCI